MVADGGKTLVKTPRGSVQSGIPISWCLTNYFPREEVQFVMITAPRRERDIYERHVTCDAG